MPRARSPRRPFAPALSRRAALSCIGAALVLGGLGCAPKVEAERAANYPLEQRTRYAWVTDELVLIQLGDDQPNVRTQANEQRLRQAIDRALLSRGFEKVARDDAELLVAFSVGTTMRYRLEGAGSGSGTSLGGVEPGQKQTKGTLNIYLVDRAQMQEVWHGWTSKWLSKSDDPDAVVEDAVTAIMAAYPGAR